MAVIFPSSPTIGQQVVGDNNVVYIWDGQKWKSANNIGPSLFGISSGVPPSGASNGDAWYDTHAGRAYVYYVSSGSAQWVDMNPTWNGTLTDGTVSPAKLSSGAPSWTASGNFIVDTNTLYVDAAYNSIGIGRTPSPWGGSNGNIRALQLGSGGCVFNWTGSSGSLSLGANLYDNGSGQQIYVNSGGSSLLTFGTDGSFSFARAAAGSPGGTISFATSLVIDGSGKTGIGTSSPLLPLDVRGQATFGAGLLISDMSWSKDANQLTYIFTGTAGAGNPSDGVITIASPNANPSNVRIGSIVFGNKVSGTSVTSNPGIKAVIDSYTNTNVANAADTGGSLNFYTKQDNGTTRLGMTINSNGVSTRQYQPAFLATDNGTFTKAGGWQLISNSITLEEYDIGSNYSTSVAGRFVAPVDGRYMFYAGGWSASNSTGHDRYAWGIKVNNTGAPKWIGGSNLSAVDTPLCAFQIVLNLTATQYVELWMFSPGSMSLGGSTHPIWWGGYLLG